MGPSRDLTELDSFRQAVRAATLQETAKLLRARAAKLVERKKLANKWDRHTAHVLNELAEQLLNDATLPS